MGDEANIVFLDRGGKTVFIEYVGKTDEYLDALYGTGLWVKNQIKEVLGEVARKMLEHPDQYVEVDVQEPNIASVPAEPVGEIKAKQEDEDSLEQRARDSVARMDRDSLREFIATNYRVSVDRRMGVSALREQAVRLIDQFGLEK